MMEKPNIIYIFCDELRTDALSCYAGDTKNARTPFIDSLSRNGIRYENCFCNSPVCVPSRMSILTGLYPEQTAVYHNEASLPPFQLKQNYRTIPSVLGENGYATASFGKTHLPWNMENGFSYEDISGSEMTLGMKSLDDSQDRLVSSGIANHTLGGTYPDNMEYRPEIVTRNAIQWISQQESPFFVRVSYLQPHTPVIVPKKHLEKNQKKYSDELGKTEELSFFERRFAQLLDMKSMPKGDIARMRHYYYSLVEWIDEQVGDILKSIPQIKNGRETVIIFGADHGVSLGENAAYGKMTFHSCAQKVPLIISHYKPEYTGMVEKKLCSNIDLARTIFGIAGVPVDSQFGGVDLLKDSPTDSVYASIGYGEKCSYPLGYDAAGDYRPGVGWPRRACLRKGNYRLDMNVRMNGEKTAEEQEDIFFTDVSLCPQEDKNMVYQSEYKEVIDDMRAEILRMSENKEEASTETLEEIQKILDDRTFFRYLGRRS